MDLTGVSLQSGDFKAGDIATALDPYLYQIADEMEKYCRERKTVVFLPLIKTSQKFRDILEEKGFRAAEVNGKSQDRAEVLEAFDRGEMCIRDRFQMAVWYLKYRIWKRKRQEKGA